MIQFFMPMEPPTVTHQEHKVSVVNGKPVFYDPPELKRARQKIIGHLCKYKPVDMEPYQEGVRQSGASHREKNIRTENTGSQSRIPTISRSC